MNRRYTLRPSLSRDRALSSTTPRIRIDPAYDKFMGSPTRIFVALRVGSKIVEWANDVSDGVLKDRAMLRSVVGWLWRDINRLAGLEAREELLRFERALRVAIAACRTGNHVDRRDAVSLAAPLLLETP